MKPLVLLFLFGLTFTQSHTALAKPHSVALIQYDADSFYNQYQTNRDRLTLLALDAVTNGANMIVMPEGSLLGYATRSRLWCRPGLSQFRGMTCDNVIDVAENVRTGRSTIYWTEFAKTHNVVIVFNTIEAASNRYFNTAVAVDANGYLSSYRKMNLYWVDEAYATAGEDLTTLDVFGTRYGFMICMDFGFSELYRRYRMRGITNILGPMDWDQSPDDAHRAGKVVFRKNAKEHGMNLLVADQSRWDSTGFYPASGDNRVRNPLPDDGVLVDGYTLIALP
jgi:N-carbamoylputrescine amidase